MGEPPDTAPSGRRWVYALLAICALGLAIRVGYVLGWRDVDEIGGDAEYYHLGANLLADGEGFIHPLLWEHHGVRLPGADHPPGYVVVLALPSLLGLDSIRDHMLASCLLGTGTVALVGVLGRRVAGARAGLLAAGLAAVYPNLWLNDGALMSESLALLLGVGVTLLAYRAWDHPSWQRFAWLGAAIGLASLARAEAALMVLLLLVPLVVWVQGLDGWRTRLLRWAIGAGAAALAMAPWVVPNLVRFEHPATLSTQMGPTLEVGNCDETYYEPYLGGWSFGCASQLDAAATTDRSVLDQETRDEALTYMGDHVSRLPVVVAARLGRAFGLYAPLTQLDADVFAEARPVEAARVGLGMYYLLVPVAIAGVVVLRRRGVPSFPLTVWVLNVAVTVVAFYGSTRFRAPAEPFLVVLAAVALDAVLRSRTDAPPPVDDHPEVERTAEPTLSA